MNRVPVPPFKRCHSGILAPSRFSPLEDAMRAILLGLKAGVLCLSLSSPIHIQLPHTRMVMFRIDGLGGGREVESKGTSRVNGSGAENG